MAILTTASARFRTELKTFANTTLGANETAYTSYEATKAGDATKTWNVRVVNAYYDGTNHVLIAEASYPERNDNPVGQVPELP